ncbi:hypothetical protein V8G54_009643 [Vigna mungo]|uniref:Uncharacterized protein n=1 Tax=Vigna mungo TaxID=3915 RepID=A0AAQ3NUD9_VIGMU
MMVEKREINDDGHLMLHAKELVQHDVGALNEIGGGGETLAHAEDVVGEDASDNGVLGFLLLTSRPWCSRRHTNCEVATTREPLDVEARRSQTKMKLESEEWREVEISHGGRKWRKTYVVF